MNKKTIYYKINLIIAKPPIKSTVNSITNRLKYFSINNLMRSPKTLIRSANKKNRALRLMIDAIKNIVKLILNVPDDIVISLNGIGVNPAVKTIQKSQVSYKFFI